MKKNNRRSLPAPPTNIFDQFLIVGLKQDTLTPVVLSTYPATNPAAPNVALFCFPEDITPENVMRLRMGASFFFVLTDEVGRQQVGFTRRTGKGKDMQCLCILTHRDSSWMYTFGSILEECEGRYKSGQLEPFLASLYVAPVPEPGKEIVLTNGATPSAPLPLQFSRPVPCPDTTDTALFGVTMLPLLANLTTLFASLLFERRTILVSAQLERVSACVQAAVSALFPFAWHHIFIPVLPLSLVDYCSAPMPFVIGLHSSLMLSLQKMPLSEVVFVDLDRDQVSAVPGDLALLPQALVAPLRAVLDAATADFHRITSSSKSNLDWQRVAEAFRHFFVRVFVGYTKFFVQKPNGIRFDKDAFIASQPKQIRKFLEVFCTSQMFERFIAEREAGKQNVLFDNEIKLHEVAQQHAGIGNAIRDNAKKSVERLTTFGNAVRTHLENPFIYHRNTENSPNLPRADKQPTSSLHPSLVRGQQHTVEPQPRRVKPLPPIPPGATPTASSAFPPNIPTLISTDWDTSSPMGRPKSATVTSSSPSAVPLLDTTPILVHSTSTNSLGSPLSVSTNVFEFNPFEVDITPATPAPSVSNTRSNDWLTPEMLTEKLAATNPFLAAATSPSRHSLPPISMRPLNPFEDNPQLQKSNTALLHSDPNPPQESHNIFTSFSLDALAPTDMHNGLGTSGSFGAFFSGHPATGSFGSPRNAGGTVPNYAAPTTLGGTVPNMAPPLSNSGGTVPNYAASSGGGTVPNNMLAQSTTSSGTIPNMAPSLSSSGGTVPNYAVGSGGGTVPNNMVPQPAYGGTVPSYGHVEQNGGRHDDFDSFFNAARATSQPQQTQQQQQQHQQPPPLPAKSAKPLPPAPGQADDFDSFLAARLSQQ